jgi:tetratricopeptide (TPR) repeat protein
MVAAGEMRSRVHETAILGLLVAVFLWLPVVSGCVTTSSEPKVDPIALAAAVRDVGLDQLRRGNNAMAIRKLREAELKNPVDPLTFAGLGEAFRRKGLLVEAEENYLLSLELSPDPHAQSHQRAVQTLAVIYIQLGRYGEAEVLCQVLIDDPTYERPWAALTNLGWAQFKAGRLQEAEASYEEALDFRSSYVVAHFNLGILKQDQGHWVEAIRQLELAVKGEQMAPDGLAEANFRMGEIYMTLGRRDRALEHFEIAAEKSPDGEWGEQSRSYLELLL